MVGRPDGPSSSIAPHAQAQVQLASAGRRAGAGAACRGRRAPADRAQHRGDVPDRLHRGGPGPEQDPRDAAVLVLRPAQVCGHHRPTAQTRLHDAPVFERQVGGDGVPVVVRVRVRLAVHHGAAAGVHPGALVPPHGVRRAEHGGARGNPRGRGLPGPARDVRPYGAELHVPAQDVPRAHLPAGVLSCGPAVLLFREDRDHRREEHGGRVHGVGPALAGSQRVHRATPARVSDIITGRGWAPA